MDSIYLEWLSAWLKFERNATLYPEGHLAVSEALAALMVATASVTASGQLLVLACYQGVLRVNGEVVPAEHKQSRELCRYFAQKGIISMTIDGSVTESALEGLVKSLQRLQPKRYLMQQQELVAEIQRLRGIRITCLDLSEVQFELGAGQTRLESSPELQAALAGYSSTEAEALMSEAQILLESLRGQLETGNSRMSLSNETIALFLENTTGGTDISPALIKLMAALSRVSAEADEPSPIGQVARVDGDTTYGSGALVDGHFEKLLERERYEAFVTEDYRQQLQQLSSSIDTAAEKAREVALLEAFSPQLIEKRVLDAFTGLLITGTAEGISPETLRSTQGLLDAALKASAYSELWQVYSQLNAILRKSPLELQDSALAQLERFFRHPITLAKMAQDYESSQGAISALRGWIHEAFGVHAPWILEQYLRHYGTAYGEHLAGLLLQRPNESYVLVQRQLEHLKASNDSQQANSEASALAPLYALLHQMTGVIGEGQIAALLDNLKAQVPRFAISKRQYPMALRSVQVLTEWVDQPVAVRYLELLAKWRPSLTPHRHRAMRDLARACLRERAAAQLRAKDQDSAGGNGDA